MLSVEDRVRRVERRLNTARTKPRKRPPFGLDWMRTYLPHYLTSAPSQLHLDIAHDLQGFHRTRGRKENRLAPRRSGKTVWATTGYGAYCALEGVEPYTLVFSETSTQANAFLRDIRTEIEENETIRRDYPESAGRGTISRDDVVRLRNGCMIQARGVGGSVRGLKNRNARPSLIIGDDLNEDEDAYSPTRRSRKLEWFKKAVMNLGNPDTNMIVLGTAIHREAIVYELYRGSMAAAWRTKTYRSVIRWPDRMDLWGEWEKIASNLGDPDREDKSRAYYEANRGEMDAGAVVLWPDGEPLYELMRHRLAVGPAAFACEKGDEPGTAGATTWPAEMFDHPAMWFDEWPDDIRGFGCYLDPSAGKSETSDFQAHVFGGWSQKANALCVQADLMREPPAAMLARAIRHAKSGSRWTPEPKVTVETNGDLGFMIAEFAKQTGTSGVGLQGINNLDSKRARIMGLDAEISRKQLRVRRTPGGVELVRQLRDDPNADHDDGPDALAGLKAVVLQNMSQGL